MPSGLYNVVKMLPKSYKNVTNATFTTTHGTAQKIRHVPLQIILYSPNNTVLFVVARAGEVWSTAEHTTPLRQSPARDTPNPKRALKDTPPLDRLF